MAQITIQEIFDISIKKGIENDPRGQDEVQEYLNTVNNDYNSLSQEEKQHYNTKHLVNPYHDSVIYYGQEKTPVTKVIVWIDVEGPEFLLVNEYNKNNKNPIDLIIGHHPEWEALLGIAKLQKGIAPFVAHRTGVPINFCEKIEHPRVEQVEQRFSPMNHSRALSFPKMLDIPYMGIHTPADNCCHMFFEELIFQNKQELNTLQDIINLLMKEPEMQIAKMQWGGPQIWNWDKTSRCGKIVVTGITWGTESSKDIYQEYAKAGVGTILEMHMSPEHLKAAKEANLNVIMTDHMASDSLWMNLILDEIEKQWVEILDFSGFTRHSRIS